MRKALGLAALIFVLCLVVTLIEQYRYGTTNFLSLTNWRNLLPRIGLYGILSLAQALVIITGGIDLSVGSLVCLVGIVAAQLLGRGEGLSPVLVIPLCLLMAGGIGAAHGVMVTRFRMQPFVVTLCGLFVYRGIARFIAGGITQGFGNTYEGLRWFGKGTLHDLLGAERFEGVLGQILDLTAAPMLVMLLIAAAVAAYLHFAAQGRHLFALGSNEEAARFSGIRTVRIKITAYVVCSLLTGLAGLLFAFKINSLSPANFGNFYELYAIAGAVLGGCSLRGGSGNVLGIVLGAALIMLLANLVNILRIPSELEYVVIGGAILTGILVDELLTRRSAHA